MRKVAATATTIALLAIGCGPGSAVHQGGELATSDTLFVRTISGIEGLEVASGEVRVSFPGGIASPDFGVVATARINGGATTIRLLTSAGKELTRAMVPGSLVPRVVSGNGDLTALTEPAEAASTGYVAAPRLSTRIVVVDSSGRARELEMKGNFEPEAFSTNTEQLFAIEYLPPEAPDRYLVRTIDIASGEVEPIGRLKISVGEQMQGTGRTHVYAPGGNELYTLYTQQPDASGTGSGSAFIHQLNLKGAWAHCIVLPRELADADAQSAALAVDPGGTRIFVADWEAGVVAVAEPGRAKASAVAHHDFDTPAAQTFAEATYDRLFVAGGSRVAVIEADSLEAVDMWSVEGEIGGMAISPDERWIYVSLADRVVILDAATGREMATIGGLQPTSIEHVASAEGSHT